MSEFFLVETEGYLGKLLEMHFQFISDISKGSLQSIFTFEFVVSNKVIPFKMKCRNSRICYRCSFFLGIEEIHLFFQLDWTWKLSHTFFVNLHLIFQLLYNSNKKFFMVFRAITLSTDHFKWNRMKVNKTKPNRFDTPGIVIEGSLGLHAAFTHFLIWSL